VRLDILHRRKAPALRTGLWLRTAWKPALVFALFAVLLSTRSVSQPQATPHIDGRNAAATSIPCAPLPAGETKWDASLGSIILPTNDTLIDPNACVGGIVVPYNATLVIDGSKGPVLISSHGAGLNVQGGELKTINTDATNTVTFDAQPEVASWDGISISADSHRKGDASLSYVSIARALTGISINSGATSSPDDAQYGLTVRNSGIVVSYFDGIDAVNTPISVTGQGDGRFGTLNNIGSFGIKVTFNDSAQAVPDKALDVRKMTFGSSVPFAETGCAPLQPCSVGGIGNDAIKATFLASARKAASITFSQFFKAGSYGVELENTSNPIVTDNSFNQNGVAATQPAGTCPSNAANKFPPIYLNNAVADLENQVKRNTGQDDGLEAIVFNGTVSSSTFTWRNATTVHGQDLGFLLNGDLNMVGGTFKVLGGSIIKAKQGTLNLNGVTLVANDSGVKTFTSLRDSTVGVDAICSVFVQSAPPSPLPAGEWGGINLLNGASGSVANTAIRYATTGVHITNSTSLAIAGSIIGPTFADGVLTEGTPLTVTGTTFGCPTGVCSGPSSGNHGILADFHGVGPLNPALKVGGPNLADRNTFRGSVNEAIRGIALTGQTVDVENNVIQNAGAIGSGGSAGIYLEGADNLTLKGNNVVGSGTGTVHYPAIWLNAVSNADFNGPISNNTGSGNGLNAIAFHGDTNSLAWQTVQATGLLGFIVDGNLLVAGDLTLANGDYAPVQAGTVTVKGGTLTSTGAVMTSLKEQTLLVASCGSVFVPKVSGVCPAKGAGDWGGLVLDPDKANQLTASEVRYATTGISVNAPSVSRTSPNLTMTNTNIKNTSADGVTTRSPLSITGGAFTSNGGRAIKIDLTGLNPAVVAPGAVPVTVTAGTTVTGSGQDGILAVGLAGQTVQIDHASVDHAGTFGINLIDAGKKAGTVDGDLTLKDNTVTNTAAGFPAIYLNGFKGQFTKISGNRGASNGLDAIAFHGTVTDSLSWQTARKTGDPTKLLGYLLDDTLTMQPGHTLTVNAGDIVKVGKGGLLDLQGVNFQADNTSTSSQKVFTSLSDNSTGVTACPSALLPGCISASAGDWGGISLTGGEANGTLVNVAIRYAATGILITSGAPPTPMPSAYRLAVFRSSIGPSVGDGIKAVNTSISVTDSTVSGGTHGITVDFGDAAPTTALRLSGNRFMSTSAEAILGQALAGQPVWITDNHVQGAGTFGIRLLSADQLVLRNNNLSGGGGGPAAGAGRYPAIYLNAVTANFAGNVRGNVGSANGLDAIVLHGTVTGPMSWITPSDQSVTHPLGYLLDGGLTVDGGDLTVHAGDVVKALAGPITINGGTLIADDASSSATKLFTSLRDNSAPAALAAVSCPSVYVSASACGAPAAGDWGGLVITEKGNGALEHALIDYAVSGVAIDSGPIQTGDLDHFGAPLTFRLTIANETQIVNTTKDGISAFDTPISVSDSTIGDPLAASPKIGAHGIIASFFSPPNCPSPTAPDCSLSITDQSKVAWTAQDGIVANGLNGQPVTITDTTVTHAGTYGIRLVGADDLTLSNNTVNASGLASPGYPAIHLSHVNGDFNTDITGNKGTGNGLDALVFDGTAANGLDWITPGATSPTLGYFLDGNLTVEGDLTTKPGDIVKILNGGIYVHYGALTSQGTVFTSLKDSAAPAACPSVFVPAPCSPPAATDWDGISIDGLASSFTNGSIRYATSGLTMNNDQLTVDGALISGLDGYAIQTTNGGYAAVTCSGIHDNGGGISSDGAPGTMVVSSDLYGNSGLASGDLDATVDTTATNVWWGRYPPLPTQYSATHVTVNNALQQQEPSVKVSGGTVEFSSDNANDAAAKLGKGGLTVTLTFDRDMNLSVPLTVTFESTIDSTVHTVAGNWKNAAGDRVTWIGSALIDGTTATAQEGLNTLTVTDGTSCVRDGNNVMAAETTPFTLDFGKATVSATGGATNIGSTSATLTDSVNPNGWSHGVQPPDLGKSDSHIFFQYKLHTDPYAVDTIVDLQALADAHPAGLLGYQAIGHGNASVPVIATIPSGTLASNQDYDYRVIAADLNDITIGSDQHFKTTKAASQLLITDPPPNVAGTPIDETISALDPDGRTVGDYTGPFSVSNTDLKATWQRKVNPQTAALFPATLSFDAADHGSVALSVIFETAGSQSLTATASGLTPYTLAELITAASASQLGYTTPPQTITAGVISGTITVQQQDAYGNPVDVTGTDLALTVTSSNTSTGHFYESDGTTALTSPKIGVGSNSTSFTYKDTLAGMPTLRVHATGLTDGTQVETVAAATLHYLALSPASRAITAGDNQAYTAEGFDQYNNRLGDVTSATTFTITPDGSCTGASCTATVADGTSSHHTVTGTDGGKTATASLTVNPGALHHLALNPASTTMSAGASQTYTAEGRDVYNNSLGDVTSTTAFTITPDGSCTGASCTATVADGTSSHHTVTGTHGGKTGTASLTVNPGALHHLVLTPPSATINAGDSQAYTAEGFDQYNNSLGDVTSATTFTITPDGICTGASCTATVPDSGTSHHTVTGTDGGKTGDASLTVN
jgi:hypothetical protein